VGRREAEFFEDACAATGLVLVARVTLPVHGADARDAVAIARRAEPDAVVTLGLWDLPRAVSEVMGANGWGVPCTANSALIYGYHDPVWARGWEGWTYVDTVSDANPRYRSLADDARAAGHGGGPTAAGAYDLGRLLAEGIARARSATRAAVTAGLERVKALPSASGHPGTRMGFGRHDRGALKGRYLVIRRWQEGRSVEW
jgi:ABC-type branched-subunit amino acid transport system substrate-binding protein